MFVNTNHGGGVSSNETAAKEQAILGKESGWMDDRREADARDKERIVVARGLHAYGLGSLL